MNHHRRAGGIPPAPLLQDVFPFISDEEREQSVLAYAARTKRAQALKFRPAPPRAPIQISIEQLALPLFTLKINESLSEDPLDAATPIESNWTAEDLAQKQRDIEWISDRASLFVGWYLERNLEMLATVGNPTEKKSIIEWIFAPDHQGDVFIAHENRWQPIYADRLPFSFQWCCRALGFAPERFQDALMESLTVAQDRVKAKHSAVFGELLAQAKEIQ